MLLHSDSLKKPNELFKNGAQRSGIKIDCKNIQLAKESSNIKVFQVKAGDEQAIYLKIKIFDAYPFAENGQKRKLLSKFNLNLIKRTKADDFGDESSRCMMSLRPIV